MSQPTPWEQTVHFSTTLGNQEGLDLDQEFDNGRLTVAELRANLALIQRDDGALQNDSVTPDTLDTATLLMMDSDLTPRGIWTTGVLYNVSDLVEVGATGSFISTVQHIAGASFAVDKAAGKWVTASGLTAAQLSSTANGYGASLVGVEDAGGFFTSANAEGALQELGAAVGIQPRAFTTVALLKAATARYANEPVSLLGYYAIGDKAERKLYWNAASTATDNGGTILQANAGGIGRWIDTDPKNITAKDFGCLFDGATDDYSRLQAAASSLTIGGTLTLTDSATVGLVSAAVSLLSGTKLVLRAGVRQTTNGKAVFKADSKSKITIEGNDQLLEGADVTQVDRAVLDFYNCTDVKAFDVKTRKGYWGIAFTRCMKYTIWNCEPYDWRQIGICYSESSKGTVCWNKPHDSVEAGAFVSYAITGTGDTAGGFPCNDNEVGYNDCDNIPSWDGFMTHECDGLWLHHNRFRNVRKGIDIGHFGSYNIIKNFRVHDNYCKSTTTNTWGATGAEHGGIEIGGLDATHMCEDGDVSNNTVDGFFQTAMTMAGNPAHILFKDTKNLTGTMNKVLNGGSANASPGIYIIGKADGLTLGPHILRGDLQLGGYRFSGVTADFISIGGGVVEQTVDNTIPAVLVTTSTLTKLALLPVATDSTVPYSKDGGSTVNFQSLLIGSQIEFLEITAPSSPVADRAFLYAHDVAAKTELTSLFATGAAQQVSVQP